MKELVNKATKTVNKVDRVVNVTYELYKYSTHYAIKIWHDDAPEMPVKVHTGKASYISGLWKDFIYTKQF